jgi:putative transposase
MNIPGKTFSNIMERYDYNPAKDAVLRFSAFNMLGRFNSEVHNR